VDKLGVESVTASGVTGVCEAVKNEQYLPSGLHPPFCCRPLASGGCAIKRVYGINP
jgi:hypothetical protein